MKKVTKNDTIVIAKMREKGLSYDDIMELTGFTYKQVKDAHYRYKNRDKIRNKAHLKKQENNIFEKMREQYFREYPTDTKIKSEGILKREMIFNGNILNFQRVNEFIAGKNVFEINISKYSFGKQERFITIVTYFEK